MHRLLLHLADRSYQAVELDEVFYLEAADRDTLVRLRGRRERRDVRRLGELAPDFEARGFFRIHRSFLVNLAKVRLLRRRDRGRDWEVKLDPPVNKVLPVSREALPGLLGAFESRASRASAL